MTMIRLAAEEDIPRVLEIEHESISPPWTHGGLLSEVYREDSFFALLVCDEKVSGYIALRCMEDEGELLKIAVAIEARRRGIADELMKAALSYAGKNGISSIYLEVRKSNEAAVSLYRKHGFKQTGLRKNYYTEPIEDALIMALEIST